MKQRIFYLDWLRVAATIMVVTIHVSAWDIGNMHHGPLSKWMAANLFESISRASVPLFVMISGALMLGRQREIGYKAFLQKRLTKILIPLAGWSFIYYIYLVHRGDFDTFSIKEFIRLAITGGISTHFWFMYMILGLYLISPLVNILIKNASTKDVRYFLLLWLFASVILKFIKYDLGYGPNIELYFVTDYVGYFVLGYYLSTLSAGRKVGIYALAAAVVGIAATFILTFYSTKKAGGVIQEFWYEYHSPNVLLAAVGLFLLFRMYFTKINKLPVIFKVTSNLSFGIYLIHILIIQLFTHEIFNYTWKYMHPGISIPVNVTIVMILSGISVFILSKIPLVKKLVL